MKHLLAPTLLSLLVLLAPPAARAQIPDPSLVCFEQQIACGTACATLEAPQSIDCICQCAFQACECALGGTGFADQCVDQVLESVCTTGIIGLLQTAPVLPDAFLPGGGFVFDQAVSGMWHDPPLTDEFTYTMTGSSKFTAILDFPAGFSQPFTVSVGEQVLGSDFGPGDTLVFPGGGVEEFVVSGIAPLVDSEVGDAFPLRLAFDTPTADFVMPEPGAALLTGAAVATLAFVRRARTRRQSR